MRVEAPLEFRRLEIIDAPRRERMLPGRQREDEAWIGGIALVVDAREKAPDLVRAEKWAFVNAFRHTVGLGIGLRR
jgi:hypothetical protein